MTAIFADDMFLFIFRNENIWISLKISPKFIPKIQVNDIPALVQIMAWCRPGDKPLPEPMMGSVSLLTHIYVTWPQWVKHAKHPTQIQCKAIVLEIFKWNCCIHDDDPCVRVCAPLTLASPLTRKQKSNWGWPGSPLEPSEGAFEPTHGSACIIGW